MKIELIILTIVICVFGFIAAHFFIGNGAFKRAVTFTGVYSVAKPDGYDVVCFLDADGKDGGLFCMPLSQAKKQ